jgi:hypothetical protein
VHTIILVMWRESGIISLRVRRLQTYVRSTMKNDRLSFLGLMHILIENLKWTCTKQWKCELLRHEGQILDNFKKFLSIKVIKIVLDSMLANKTHNFINMVSIEG